MALTATATRTTFDTIAEKLALQNPKMIVLSPERLNIFYRVDPPVTVSELATNLGEELAEKWMEFPKTVIFCRKYQDCSDLYLTLRNELGRKLTEPSGNPDLSEFRMVEIYTHVSRPANREKIIERFCTANCTLRIVIATISFGMGIDCPEI